MPRFFSGGRAMHVLDLPAPPDRPTLVFLHGAGGDHTVWGEQVAALRGRAGIFAPDFPSHGRSEGPPDSTVAELAGTVRSLIEGRGLSPPIVVGHSMGGAVALELALSTTLAGLVLIGTNANLAVSQRVLDLIEADPPAAVRQIARFAYALGVSEDLIERGSEYLSKCDPATLLVDFCACNAFDARERLGEIRLPTLVLCGTADRLTFPLQAEWMAERIPGAEFRLMAGAGHLVIIERAPELNAILGGWLESRFPPAGRPGAQAP